MGSPSHETNEAIRLAARTEAMITDPVYEGKSMQGMIDLAKKGFSRRTRRFFTPTSEELRRLTVTATPTATAKAERLILRKPFVAGGDAAFLLVPV
jgi:hypothetical protein